MKLPGRRKKQPSDTPLARRREAIADVQTQRPSATDLSNRYSFRRNRTLTGSSSANVASSNELNAELQSPRAHVHHLSSLRRRLVAYLSFSALAAFGLYLLLAQLVATQSVQVKDVALLTKEDTTAYQQAIESYYAARPAERLRFLLNKQDLLAHIQSTRPEVKTVQLEQGASLGEALIMIVAREPIARWSVDSENQYVDGDGMVFARSFYGDPGLQIIDNSGIRANSSRLVASNRFLGFIGRVIAGSSKNGLNVSAVTIPTATTRQVTLKLTGKATLYKLSVDRSAGQQVEDIARINRYLSLKNLSPGYVDVRIAGKAFYK